MDSVKFTFGFQHLSSENPDEYHHGSRQSEPNMAEYITAGSEGCSAQLLKGCKRDLLLSEGWSLGLTYWKL